MIKIGQIYKIATATGSKIMVKVKKCRKIKNTKYHIVYEYEVRILNSHTDEYATFHVELIFAQFCDTIQTCKLITETGTIDIQHILYYNKPACAVSV